MNVEAASSVRALVMRAAAVAPVGLMVVGNSSVAPMVTCAHDAPAATVWMMMLVFAAAVVDTVVCRYCSVRCWICSVLDWICVVCCWYCTVRFWICCTRRWMAVLQATLRL